MNILFLTFVLTILLSRSYLFFVPQAHSPRWKNFQVHHYMYGLLLLVISFLIKSGVLYSVGLGLFADELPLFFTNKWNKRGYDEAICRLFLIVIIIMVWFSRGFIFTLFEV
jgi:predicted membrane channel-forming protein YqfA (hemolysin III family)